METTTTNAEIVTRFFAALERLKSEHIIRGLQTFTRRYGLNRWNVQTLAKQPERGIFQVVWLTHLVNDYNVSALWLLTGKGQFWQSDNEPAKSQKVQIIGKRKTTPVQVVD